MVPFFYYLHIYLVYNKSIMKKFKISNEEKNRILSLHESAIKRHYLKEQPNTSNYGNCTGNVPISEPTGMIRNIEMVGDNYHANFILEAYFVATESNDSSFRDALTKLKKSIDAQIRKKNLENEGLGFAKIIDISEVIGSASNYLDGPLKPTVSNRGKELSAEVLNEPPYKNLPKEGNPKWEKNLEYAKNRWSSMVNFINGEGSDIGFRVSSNINPNNIKIVITDTGGCIDERRDTANYPVSGQYVKIRGTVQLMKDSEEEPEEEIIRCADGLKMIIGYFPQATNIAGINFKNTSSSHSCNYATYDIYLNGVKIGVSNMNNDIRNSRTFDSPAASIGKDEPGYNGPTVHGGRVYTIFDVPSSEIEEIAKKSESGEIVISMEGTDGALRRDKRNMHGDAPLVCAIVEGDGENRVVYGPKEPFKSDGGFNDASLRELGTFDPCNEVKVIPKV